MAGNPRIKRICNKMGEYYKSLNAKYDKDFEGYCNENGLEDDGFDDLLDEDPADAILVDFAKKDDKFEFPFGSYKLSTDKEQAEFILKLIQKIDKNPDIHFDPAASVYNAEYFDIKENDVEKVKQMYKNQCPAIYNQKLKSDKGFLQMLAITDIKHNDDYMLHLVDDFARKRVENIVKNKNYDENDWLKDNPHFRIAKDITNTLQDKNNKLSPAHYAEIIKAAVSSFHKRCCTRLLFNNNKLINDSIENILSYIDAATIFIKTIITDANRLKKTVCPFQFDMCIASGEPELINKDEQVGSDDEDDKTDYGNDDPNSRFVDIVGDIKEKLENNNMKYTSTEYNFQSPSKTGKDDILRLFTDLLEEFKKLDDEKENFVQDIINRKRLIAFIDRRKSKDNESENSDTIFLYKPPFSKHPNYVYTMPDNKASLWGISASKTCLLPNLKYNEKEAINEPNANAKKLNNENTETKNPSEDKNIGASDHCKNGLITLSFIVKSEDVIKMYLYYGGSILRFMPDDIQPVFKTIFNLEYGDNRGYIENKKELDILIQKMNDRIVDKEFERFQKKIFMSHDISCKIL